MKNLSEFFQLYILVDRHIENYCVGSKNVTKIKDDPESDAVSEGLLCSQIVPIIKTYGYIHRWALLLCQVTVTSLPSQWPDKLYRLHCY